MLAVLVRPPRDVTPAEINERITVPLRSLPVDLMQLDGTHLLRK